MKTYRPYKAGYIALYVLVLICVADAVSSVYRYIMAQASGVQNYQDMFLIWSLLLCPLAIAYGSMYFKTRITIDSESLTCVRPIMYQPDPGAKRAMFLFRSGDKDYKVVKLKFDLAKVVAFGYVEDLNFKPQDKSETGANNKLFPLHEVAFQMESGKVNRVNIAVFSKKQQKQIFDSIRAINPIEAKGQLAKDIQALN